MAYSIDTKFMYYATVRIHKVSKCERCGGIISEEVESYKKLGLCSTHFIKEEEKVLRKRGLLSITEAYQKLEGYEIGKGENG